MVNPEDPQHIDELYSQINWRKVHESMRECKCGNVYKSKAKILYEGRTVFGFLKFLVRILTVQKLLITYDSYLTKESFIVYGSSTTKAEST